MVTITNWMIVLLEVVTIPTQVLENGGQCIVALNNYMAGIQARDLKKAKNNNNKKNTLLKLLLYIRYGYQMCIAT